MVFSAEGFAHRPLAAEVTWTLFDERDEKVFATVAESATAPLYLVDVMTLAHAIASEDKQPLGRGIAEALLEAEGSPATPHCLSRIWVRFVDVADGDLVVGGESASLAGLRTLMSS
jgi:hypothetical protein